MLIKNVMRGTYNHAQYLDGRREMMQWYADYIDSLMEKKRKNEISHPPTNHSGWWGVNYHLYFFDF